VPKHAFDGPVVWSLARSRGVHLGDLFGVLIAGVVLYRSIAFAWRGTLRPRRGRPDAHSRSTDS
jgi:hypothetical protein